MLLINYFYSIRNLTEKYIEKEKKKFSNRLYSLQDQTDIVKNTNYDSKDLNELLENLKDFEIFSADFKKLYEFYNQLIGIELKYSLFNDYLDKSFERDFIMDLNMTLNVGSVFGNIITEYALPILERVKETGISLTDNRTFNHSILNDLKDQKIIDEDEREILEIASVFGYKAVLNNLNNAIKDPLKAKDEAVEKIKFVSLFKNYHNKALTLQTKGENNNEHN